MGGASKLGTLSLSLCVARVGDVRLRALTPLAQQLQGKSICINGAVLATSVTVYTSSQEILLVLDLVGAAATSALRRAVAMVVATKSTAAE